MIDLQEVGARPFKDAQGDWQVHVGLYLPGITFHKGYSIKIRVIHELDQFIRGIEPRDFFLNWVNGSPLDLWETTIRMAPESGTHFGSEGKYLYRYQVLRDDQEVTFWVADPFARETGLGTLSGFTLASHAQPFNWTDNHFTVPEVDELVVYELHVSEFNQNFDGVIAQLDYLWDLGVNTLELMPVTDVKEEVEWGYTPLGFFAPDERLGGPEGMKSLVNACHERGMAVILDAVYAHAHPEFAYNLIYETTGEPNPMMGYFEGEFFSNPGMDYRKEFTRGYFFEVNRYWLQEYHVDGFRYDYVPGIYDGPAGQGYANLVYRTYQESKSLARFQAPGDRSRIIQCAEHLPDPKGILSQTYSNTCWQNGLLDEARAMAKSSHVRESFAHQLDPNFLGYAAEYQNPGTGERFPVAPFQYVESHDHSRFIVEFGRERLTDLLGQPYGDRDRFYKMQPYVIALYTAKGIPMLWQGQEFGENWAVPGSGIGRNLFKRPLHWEYFYDRRGKALVRLHRIMGELRRAHRALRSRGFFYYFSDENHRRAGVIAFRREAAATADHPAESLVVLVNFFDQDADVWVQFPSAGEWLEQIDKEKAHTPSVLVGQSGEWRRIRVASNYGAVYVKQ
jgi:1,4-alpha-glucan branching enzyme